MPVDREPCRECRVLFDPRWLHDGLCINCYHREARKNAEGWRDG